MIWIVIMLVDAMAITLAFFHVVSLGVVAAIILRSLG